MNNNEKEKRLATRMGFEPTRAEHNGLAVHRLNHSATSSDDAILVLSFVLTLFSYRYFHIYRFCPQNSGLMLKKYCKKQSKTMIKQSNKQGEVNKQFFGFKSDILKNVKAIR